MAQVNPFTGIRPRPELAGDIIAPPYDVLSGDEAREIAGPNPKSFLHVTRPDVDLADGVDIHGPAAYARARENLDHFIDRGWMIQDKSPCFYLYSQTWRGRTQVALMALASVDEYDQGLIKKHELTRPDKENDRVEHITALQAQTGLVFLAYRDDIPELRKALLDASEAPPAWIVDTADGVQHVFQVIKNNDRIRDLRDAFAKVPALYIADGHHRSAAASRVAKRQEGGNNWFLAGIFPDSQLRVLAYNRVVRGLNGHTSNSLLTAVGEHFDITPGVDPVPGERGRWTMYLQGTWYGLAAKPGVVPDDPVGGIDASVLQDRVLGPLLGIDNPRTNERIDFVGGVRGHEALSAAVDGTTDAVAFHLFPTGMDQLFAVADADKLMPPKCTWFEPKLRGGVLVNKLG